MNLALAPEIFDILFEATSCNRIKNIDSFYCRNQKSFKITKTENCWKRENTHLITARKKDTLLLTTPHRSMKCCTYEQQYKKKGNPIASIKERASLNRSLRSQIKAQRSQWPPLHSLQGTLYETLHINTHSFSHITSHKSTIHLIFPEHKCEQYLERNATVCQSCV